MASSYYEKLRDPRWQKIRLRVFGRAGFACEACGAKDETLSVHHGLYRYGLEPWELPGDTLWCLCEGCHLEYQDHLSDVKLEIGRTNPKLYGEILRAILAVREREQQPHRDQL